MTGWPPGNGEGTVVLATPVAKKRNQLWRCIIFHNTSNLLNLAKCLDYYIYIPHCLNYSLFVNNNTWISPNLGAPHVFCWDTERAANNREK